MKFEKEITVAVPSQQVWAFLWDVERVARCIPGCRDTRTIVPRERYQAVVSERVGPFKVQFPMEIQVLEADEPRHLKAQASGRDSAVGSSLKVTLDLSLESAGEATRLVINAEASILGKLGTLGHGIIQHKADGIMTEFAETLRQELEDRGRTAAPAG